MIDRSLRSGGRRLSSGLRRPNRPVAEVALWFAPVAAFVAVALAHGWTSDLGFMYFRVVEHLRAGHGAVFNAGERVEVFASPLWVLTLLLADLVSPLRIEVTAMVLGVALAAAGMILATVASASLASRGHSKPVLIPLGAAVFAALWPVWVWTASGTEIGLAVGWVGASTWVLARWARGGSDPRVAPSALVLLGAGWLVRPELLLSSAIFVAVVVGLTPMTRQRRWAVIAMAFAAPVAYQIARMGYYGMLLPASATARDVGTLRPGLGWEFAVDAASPYLVVIPLVAFVCGVSGPLGRTLYVHGHRRRAAVLAAVTVSGLLHGAVIGLLGGDVLHARLLVPALFAALAPCLLVPWSRRRAEILAVAGAWVPLAAFVLRPDPDSARRWTGYVDGGLTAEDRGVNRGLDQPWFDGPGVYATDAFGFTATKLDLTPANPDAVVVITGAPGLVGYALGPSVHIVDLRGLSNPVWPNQALAAPGQAESIEAATVRRPWLLAAIAADPIDAVRSVAGLGGDANAPLVEMLDVAWAQAAADCGVAATLRDSSSGDLGPAEFLTNIARAGSNTALRVDPDPRTDYRTRCPNALPDSVAALQERVVEVERLPTDPDDRSLAVVGNCAVVFGATGEADGPWEVLDAARVTATIEMTVDDQTPRSAELFVVGPFGDDARAVARVETDGSGNYRLRQDLDWFPPDVQAWTPIPPSGEVRVAYVPDFVAGRWKLAADFTFVASLPMLSSGTVVAQPVASSAGPDAPTVVVRHDRPNATGSCLELVDPLAAIR